MKTITNDQTEFLSELSVSELAELIESVFFQYMDIKHSRNFKKAKALGLTDDNGVVIAEHLLWSVKNSSI